MAQTQAVPRTILVLPPLRWDSMGAVPHIAVQQVTGDLTRIMGGLQFGMKPEDVSRLLPRIGGELHWHDLPAAKEFSEDVRFVRMPMQAAGPLRAGITACFGEPSDVVLLFRANGLFRVSFRFLPDQSCPKPHDAAEALFAAYVPIVSTLVVSTHYRTGPAEVVDISDPAAGASIAQRWQASQ